MANATTNGQTCDSGAAEQSGTTEIMFLLCVQRDRSVMGNTNRIFPKYPRTSDIWLGWITQCTVRCNKTHNGPVSSG